jgi:hypothetical protein
MNDDKLANLVSIFENATDAQIQSALNESKGDLENAIDLLLSPVTDDNPRKRKNVLMDAFQMLNCPTTRIPFKSRMQLLPGDISNYLPCVLFPNFLPDLLAESLLNKLIDESSDWKVRSFSLFGRGMRSSHF